MSELTLGFVPRLHSDCPTQVPELTPRLVDSYHTLDVLKHDYKQSYLLNCYMLPDRTLGVLLNKHQNHTVAMISS